jgi:hypothetical protein
MSIPTALAEAVEAVASFLNPEKHEKRVLRRAIEAAEQLLMVLRREGRYAKFSDEKLKEYEIHYQKQFNAWRDGV